MQSLKRFQLQEKERTTEIRKLEAEFMKEWIKVRDDLKLEDLKVNF